MEFRRVLFRSGAGRATAESGVTLNRASRRAWCGRRLVKSKPRGAQSALCRDQENHRQSRPVLGALVYRSSGDDAPARSEEHTSELQSLMRISYAVSCLKTQTINPNTTT